MTRGSTPGYLEVVEERNCLALKKHRSGLLGEFTKVGRYYRKARS